MIWTPFQPSFLPLLSLLTIFSSLQPSPIVFPLPEILCPQIISSHLFGLSSHAVLQRDLTQVPNLKPVLLQSWYRHTRWSRQKIKHFVLLDKKTEFHSQLQTDRLRPQQSGGQGQDQDPTGLGLRVVDAQHCQ